jgi:hypothetical protein
MSLSSKFLSLILAGLCSISSINAAYLPFSPYPADSAGQGEIHLPSSSSSIYTVYRNAISIGIGGNQGDVTYGYYAFLGAALYSRRLSGAESNSQAEIECALAYTSRTLNGRESGGGAITVGGVSSGLAQAISRVWMFDVSYSNAFFADRFRFVVGPSLRWSSNFSTVIVALSPYDRLITDYSQTLRLGGHFKLHYAIPLSERSEIDIRGQLHLYLGDFSTGLPQIGAVSIARYGTLSIGVFFRGMW